jgi:hypothetical protein
VAPDGRPADRADGNVPYRPKAWLRVSAAGVRAGDPVEIAGYPGRTQRHLTASAVEAAERWFYPLRSKTYADVIAILEAEGRRDPAVALKVSSQVKSLGNGETNARGQVEGLRRNGVLERARAADAKLAKFLGTHAGRDRAFFLEQVERAPGPLGSALSALRRADERGKPDLDRDAGFQDRDLDRARQREKDLTRSLSPAANRRALAYLVERAMESSGEDRIRAFDETFGAGAPAASIEEKLGRFDAMRRKEREIAGALLVVRPRWLEGRRALLSSEGGTLYPDANGTLRVSFATVKGYSPREAVEFSPRTTLKGLLEKERGAEPFASPPKLLAKARTKEFGRWADGAQGSVPVAFLSDGDTTGGNSGSPTLNGKGELVGLNFDRVWENVAGDFGWSPERSRNVNVDIRYALWLAEVVDGNAALVREALGKE